LPKSTLFKSLPYERKIKTLNQPTTTALDFPSIENNKEPRPSTYYRLQFSTRFDLEILPITRKNGRGFSSGWFSLNFGLVVYPGLPYPCLDQSGFSREGDKGKLPR
jgi:hypothetical protein